jgi:hypothetical protein
LAKSQSMEQVMCIAELEESGALLRAELDAPHSKLAEIEHRKGVLTSKNEGLKRDFGVAGIGHDAAAKEKDLVQQTK